jgi:hypothetical protein
MEEKEAVHAVVHAKEAVSQEVARCGTVTSNI